MSSNEEKKVIQLERTFWVSQELYSVKKNWTLWNLNFQQSVVFIWQLRIKNPRKHNDLILAGYKSFNRFWEA